MQNKIGGVFMEYKITHVWDDSISNVHHITIEYNGNSYSVIFGKYINGGFFCIPNWGVGGELGHFCDTFWNEESLSRTLKSKRAAKAIAMAIAEFREMEE